jgi:hypothetical protein
MAAIPWRELPAGAAPRSLWVITRLARRFSVTAQPHSGLIPRYVDAWNEPNPTSRRAGLASLYEAEGLIAGNYQFVIGARSSISSAGRAG